jgi:hypothetical protein
MRFIYQILRATPLAPGLSFQACFKSTAFRLLGKVNAQPFSWKVQLSFVARMTWLIVTIPFRLRRRPGIKAILYNVASTPDQRRYFYQKYQAPTLHDSEILTLHHDRPAEPLYFTALGWTQISRLWRGAWLLWRATFCSAFWRSRINPHWKIRFANLMLQQVLFEGPGHDQMLYFCYEPETYLSTLVASMLVRGYHPKVASSNSPLFRDNRYLYNPQLDLKLCSRIHEVEVVQYQQLGWMQVRSTALWGLEESMVYDQLQPAPPIYDLGIYSSGGWARTHDLWRSTDIARLRRGGFLDNPMYLQLQVILDEVARLRAAFPQLTVAFYLHPHELGLYQKHGIRPPYLDRLDAEGIHYSLAGSDSQSRIYEPRLGVAVLSTILFDRLHLGLKSLFYNGTAIPNGVIETRYLGDYARYGYVSAQEFGDKMVVELGLGE